MNKETPSLTPDRLDLARYGERYKIKEDSNEIYYCFSSGNGLVQLIRYDEKKEIGIMTFVDIGKSKLAKKLVGDRDDFEILPVENVKELKTIICEMEAIK